MMSENFIADSLLPLPLMQMMRRTLYRAWRDGTTSTEFRWTQAARRCWVFNVRGTPLTYWVPAYTAGSNSAPLSLRNVDSASCNSFQINAVAFSTFLKRLAAVVRSRTVANGDSTTLLVRKCGQ